MIHGIVMEIYSSTFDIHLLQHFWLFLQFRVWIPNSINL